MLSTARGVAGIDGTAARPTVAFGVLTGKKKREGKKEVAAQEGGGLGFAAEQRGLKGEWREQVVVRSMCGGGPLPHALFVRRRKTTETRASLCEGVRVGLGGLEEKKGQPTLERVRRPS